MCFLKLNANSLVLYAFSYMNGIKIVSELVRMYLPTVSCAACSYPKTVIRTVTSVTVYVDTHPPVSSYLKTTAARCRQF